MNYLMSIPQDEKILPSENLHFLIILHIAAAVFILICLILLLFFVVYKFTIYPSNNDHMTFLILGVLLMIFIILAIVRIHKQINLYQISKLYTQIFNTIKNLQYKKNLELVQTLELVKNIRNLNSSSINLNELIHIPLIRHAHYLYSQELLLENISFTRYETIKKLTCILNYLQ